MDNTDIWNKLCEISEDVGAIKSNQENVAADLKQHLIDDKVEKTILTASIVSLQSTRTNTEVRKSLWSKTGHYVVSGIAFIVSIIAAFHH